MSEIWRFIVYAPERHIAIRRNHKLWVNIVQVPVSPKCYIGTTSYLLSTVDNMWRVFTNNSPSKVFTFQVLSNSSTFRNIPTVGAVPRYADVKKNFVFVQPCLSNPFCVTSQSVLST